MEFMLYASSLNREAWIWIFIFREYENVGFSTWLPFAREEANIMGYVEGFSLMHMLICSVDRPSRCISDQR